MDRLSKCGNPGGRGSKTKEIYMKNRGKTGKFMGNKKPKSNLEMKMEMVAGGWIGVVIY